MGTLARDGVDLAYAEVGAGRPVVLHTGGAGSSSMWQRGGYVDRMPGFRLILLDHRGRGASSRPTALADHRVSEYATDVTALIGCTTYGFWRRTLSSSDSRSRRTRAIPTPGSCSPASARPPP